MLAVSPAADALVPTDRPDVAVPAVDLPLAVEAVDLRWQYLRRGRPALDGITFRLEPGRVLLVLGPSGCGKSTLARALVGLVPHVLPGEWSGSLRIGNLEVAETPARLLGERVGLVFQDPDSQLVMARVADEVAFGLENRGWQRAEMRRRVPEVLGTVGLTGFESRATAALSGGEKQRLAIADVLAAAPRVLVFDEPTANLDPPGMHETFEQLGSLTARRAHTTVLIEHRLEAAFPLADVVLLLDRNGRQIAVDEAPGIRRESIELLDRTGAWVPRAWRGTGVGRASPQVVSRPGVVAGRRTAARPGGTAAPAERAEREIVLEAAGVGVDYPPDAIGTASRTALDSVDLVVHAGERVAIVGPNGCGKTTLLMVLAGLLRPTRGRATVAGRDPARLRGLELPQTVGVAFQDPELGFVARTAEQEVLATPRAIGASASPGEAAAVLQAFGLEELAAVEPFRLSQGEQRRLSLAAYALRPPAVLLLDEPTFGLDRQGTEAVFRLLDRLTANGAAQLLATHDPRLLPSCDRVVGLQGGRIVFDGPPERFLADPPYRPQEPWQEPT